MEQGSPEWHAVRCGKFTGSRFADLMATTRSGSAASRANLITTIALERITGAAEPTYENDAMRRGRELEPLARGAYEAHTGALVELVAFTVHPKHPFIGVSPDGLVDAKGLAEFKCPASSARHLAALRTNAHATEYRWQIQGQIWVEERDWCDAVSYHPMFPSWAQLAICRVERDDKAIAELEAACLAAEAEVQDIVNELQSMRKAA